MKETFLSKVAQKVVEADASLEKACFIFPNKRSALKFKQELVQQIANVIWSPTFYSSEDFVYETTALKPIDTLDHLVVLFKEIKKKYPKEEFKKFIHWGQNLLNDFNEIDSFLVDTKKLFTDIKYIKELEQWNKQSTSLSQIQLNFDQLWANLNSVYNATNKELLESKQAYPGLAYRYLVKNADKLLSPQEFSMYYFVGFNAFNKCEEEIITYLLKKNKCTLFFDADEYYLNNTLHEGGKFIRTLIKQYRKHESAVVLIKEQQLKTQKKKIHVIGAPGNSIQAELINDIVSSKINKDAPTAIILPDEMQSLLLTQTLTENYYITIGYPIGNSSISEFVMQWVELHQNKLFSDEKEKLFYHKSFLQILSHPLLEELMGPETCSILKNKIISTNLTQVNLSFVLDVVPKEAELVRHLFNPINKSSDVEHFFLFLFEQIEHKIIPTKSVDEKVIFIHYKELLFELIHTISNKINPTDFSLDLFKLVLNLKIANAKIPYKSDQTSNLQVMGMLETRCLDFETVIITSVNEGVVPAGKSFNSFIPFDIRCEYGLPTHQDKDAIFSYHFYRLLQRAKTVYLTYSLVKDVFGSKEKSRYIYQLQNELCDINPAIELTEYTVGFTNANMQAAKIEIEKTEDVKSKVAQLLTTGISASALINFLECELKFYLTNVLRIKENTEVSESIEQNVFGTALHSLLEFFYKDLIGRKLAPEDYKIDVKLYEQELKNILLKNNISQFQEGANLLIYRVIFQYFTKFLQSESKLTESNSITVLHQEKEFKREFKFDNESFILKGKIDRIDLYNNQLRIIDYKTGVVEKKEVTINSIAEVLTKDNTAKTFQLLFYGWITNQEFRSNKQLLLMSLRNINSTGFPLTIKKNNDITDSDIADFEQELATLLRRIANPDKPFTQTSNIETCAYCNFKTMCNR
ncbi:MAG: PD-(D/E)XK nuclease family protein [Bacteroidetes bacterium]|nr:PD-(D/E)XK nuclease family protein [Bacteroidota bacterium]